MSISFRNRGDFPIMKPALLISSAVLLWQSAAAQIFADFHTTAGDFTCELAYQAAPQTVANFIGLAEGSRTWIDPATGAMKSGVPYYDGTKFHRVIAGFMNQGGSRNGLGTDGPGYVFRDETDNGLDHSQPYVLSMANSGANTNGAQFFITVSPQNHLDGKHTVFGNVTTGQAVVDAINTAPKHPNPKPDEADYQLVDPVFINSIEIRREGDAAQVFDIHAQDLPVCVPAAGRLVVKPNTSTKLHLDAPLPGGSMIKVFRSTNLSSWNDLGSLFQGTDATGHSEIQFDPAEASRAFYQPSIVLYPDALAPAAIGGRTLRLEWTAGGSPGFLQCEFDGAGTGGSSTSSATSGSTPISSASYGNVAPWSAACDVSRAGFPVTGIDLSFRERSAAHLSGTFDLYEHNGTSWIYRRSGTFTLTR